MVESGDREIPVLYRQYQKLGAKFYGLGLDKNFANTPGLLLSVDLSKTPEASLKRYIGLTYEELKTQTPEGHKAQRQFFDSDRQGPHGPMLRS